MATYRAGIIGVNLGREHARSYFDCPDTELVALADIDPVRLNAIGDKYDVPASGRYATHLEMLEKERLDIVSVCTPQTLHAQMTIDAARYAPKAIACEKAMATSMGEAEAMLAACDRAKVKLIIGHQGRHFAPFQRARELIAEGAIGKPLVAAVGYAEGGMLNIASHMVDRCLYLLGDPEPLWVIAQVQRETDRYERSFPCEDLCMGIACVQGGARIIIDGDIGRHGGLNDFTFLLTGDQGTIRLEIEPNGAHGRPALHLVSATHGSKVLPSDAWPEVDHFLAQTTELVAWLNGGPGHRQDAHHVIKSHAILMGMYESARTHTLVHLPVRTKRNPLIQMIEDGTLPVRYPGRYDIRHRTTRPVEPKL
ncbi:MAG: Gfo/Idh/MocA family oxidoreductase [Actinobacteria bacterium]|nr:Gfo/Idh/MocA family oxidoreductase [Actinomycetota bacterium]